MKHGRSFIYSILLLSLFLTTSAFALEPGKVKELLEENKSEQAYTTGTLQNVPFSPDIKTNYSYGVAALDSGHIPEAIFAFERVLMLDPKNTDALFQLGRAYFMLQSYKMSQSYFLQVLANNPSPELRQETEQYLQMIQERAPELSLRKLAKYLFVDFSNGYDSNINAATTSLVFVLPVGILNLFPGQLAHADGFNDTYVKGGLAKPLTDVVTIFGDGGVEQRTNYTVPGFNYSVLDADSGFNFFKGPYKLSVPLAVEEIYTGNSPFRGYLGVSTILSRIFEKIDTIDISSTVQTIAYPGINTARDQYLAIFSADTNWTFAPIDTRLLGSVYYVEGNALDPTGGFFVRDFTGAQAIFQWIKLKNNTPFINFIVQNSFYNGIDPGFLRRRHDHYYEAGVGWNWKFAKHWNIQPQYMRIWNNSNLPLYQYHRYLAQVSVIYLS